MLVLQRCLNESIYIGHDIKITILRVRKGSVRLSIDAPKELEIHREEIYNKIKKQELNNDS